MHLAGKISLFGKNIFLCGKEFIPIFNLWKLRLSKVKRGKSDGFYESQFFLVKLKKNFKFFLWLV